MDAIARYNVERDRETAAFKASPVGLTYRDALNGHFARLLTSQERQRFPDMIVTLAAMVAFESHMPAFYALTSLRAANPGSHWVR